MTPLHLGDRSSPNILPLANGYSGPPSPTESTFSSSRRHSRLPQSSNLSISGLSSIRVPVVLRRYGIACYPGTQQTKNTWARDDPSFALLLSGFFTLSAIAWGIAYSPGFVPILRLIVNFVLIDFLVVGVVVATIGWVVTGRFLKQRSGRATLNVNPQESELEWAYCFDVHCNAFLIIWFALYVVQFILLPVIIRESWFSLLLGNLLYLGAFSYYIVITYLGYNALPFLERTEFILSPILVFVILFLASLFGFNIAKHAVNLYFG
ncbi:UNC-50 family-domain-containing protein [Lipomyces japonicus]|uniref:UNC-50 family-domain-containing protein n=1 Tax=Lipomyces japonicus TaxID=56871 RepID=UPI0034CFE24A